MPASTRRWRRYGNDRLYVSGSDGVRLGYRDLLSGEDHLEHPERRVEFLAALAERDQPEPAQPGAGPVSDATAAPVEPEAPAKALEELAEEPDQELEEDLSQRVAGHAARQQAEQHRQAAPVRTLLARLFGVHTEERAWRVGAEGESLVGRQLDRLIRKDPRWHVLHAVPIGERGADIDHVVVGPAGVLTLNAKHHPKGTLWVAGDTVLVNGQRQPYVRNSRHEARRVGKLLTSVCGFPVPCRGVVVPVRCRVTMKQQPEDVKVVGRRELHRWLSSLPQVLPDQDVEQVFAVARRSSTWSA